MSCMLGNCQLPRPLITADRSIVNCCLYDILECNATSPEIQFDAIRVRKYQASKLHGAEVDLHTVKSMEFLRAAGRPGLGM